MEAGRALFSSPRLAVRRVEIQAEASLARELAAKLPLSAGANLLLLKTGRLAGELARVRRVSSLRVCKRWPDGLLVKATAREGRAVCRAGKKAVFYDREGWPFTLAAEAWGWELPELVGPGLAAVPTAGEGTRAGARQLLSCLEALEAQGIKRPRRLSLDSRGRVRVELASGVELRLGRPRELEAKARRLRAVLASLAGKEEAEYIDVSSPHGVVWKPRERQQPSRVSGRSG